MPPPPSTDHEGAEQERPSDWRSPLRRLAEALKTRAGEITGDGGASA